MGTTNGRSSQGREKARAEETERTAKTEREKELDTPTQRQKKEEEGEKERREQQPGNHQQNNTQSAGTEADDKNKSNEPHLTPNDGKNVLTTQREEEIEQLIETWRERSMRKE